MLIFREKNDPGTGSSQEASADKNMEAEDDGDLLDNSPLFFQPGKTGFYSLRPGKNSVERMNCFRNVGR